MGGDSQTKREGVEAAGSSSETREGTEAAHGQDDSFPNGYNSAGQSHVSSRLRTKVMLRNCHFLMADSKRNIF